MNRIALLHQLKLMGMKFKLIFLRIFKPGEDRIASVKSLQNSGQGIIMTLIRFKKTHGIIPDDLAVLAEQFISIYEDELEKIRAYPDEDYIFYTYIQLLERDFALLKEILYGKKERIKCTQDITSL